MTALYSLTVTLGDNWSIMQHALQVPSLTKKLHQTWLPHYEWHNCGMSAKFI